MQYNIVKTQATKTFTVVVTDSSLCRSRTKVQVKFNHPGDLPSIRAKFEDSCVFYSTRMFIKLVNNMPIPCREEKLSMRHVSIFGPCFCC
jgi:hypothetical protein